MAELVYARDLKSLAFTGVWVRFPLWPPSKNASCYTVRFCISSLLSMRKFFMMEVVLLFMPDQSQKAVESATRKEKPATVPESAPRELEQFIEFSRDHVLVDLGVDPEWEKGDVYLLRSSYASLQQLKDTNTAYQEAKPGQDRVFMAPHRGLYVVADGMGGSFRGEIAASLFGKICLELSMPDQARGITGIRDPRLFFQAAARECGRQLVQMKKQFHWNKDVFSGACMVAAYVHPRHEVRKGASEYTYARTRVTIASVGDCAAMALEPSGEVRPLVKIDRPRVSASVNRFEANYAKESNMVASFIGNPGIDNGLQLAFEEVTLREGEILMLCTDGVDANIPITIPDAQIREALEPKKLLDALHKMVPGGLIGIRDEALFLRQLKNARRKAELVPKLRTKPAMDLERLWGMPTLERLLAASIKEEQINPKQFMDLLNQALIPSDPKNPLTETRFSRDDFAVALAAPKWRM